MFFSSLPKLTYASEGNPTCFTHVGLGPAGGCYINRTLREISEDRGVPDNSDNSNWSLGSGTWTCVKMIHICHVAKITDLRNQTSVTFAFCYLADDGCYLESHIWRSRGSGQSSCSVFAPERGEKWNKHIRINEKILKNKGCFLISTQIQLLLGDCNLFCAMEASENPLKPWQHSYTHIEYMIHPWGTIYHKNERERTEL